MDHLDISFRFEPSTDAAEFTGYAAVWGERNAHGEIVERGAFSRTLAEHRAAGTRPVMLWAHIPSEIIGTWTEIREDDKGLHVTGRLLTEITAGREAYERMKAQAVTGISIGFRTFPGGERRSGGVRYLTAISLAEISIVGSPSAGKARITAVRSNAQSATVAAFVETCRATSRQLRNK